VYIPEVASRFALSPAGLTAALLVVAVGAMSAMVPVGLWISRVGSARVSLVGACVVAAAMVLIPHASNLPFLLVCLLVFGAGNGMFDTAMNAQAVTVERHRSRSVLSAMHGMFSVGGMAGALLGVWKLNRAWADEGVFALVAVMTFVMVSSMLPLLLADQATSAPSHATPRSIGSRPLPSGALIGLGVLAFCGLMIEGAMYDWSAIYLRNVVQAPGWWAGLGYGGFCMGMTIGRFNGDAARMQWGDVRVLQSSSLVVLAGLLLAVLAVQPWAAALGLAAVGLGTANLVPVLFAAGARAVPDAPAQGIAQVSRLAYVGFLLGPVGVGWVAQGWGLRAGLAFTGLCALWIALQARKVAPGPSR
jgi:predicted MFS family arabinose efflux permease